MPETRKQARERMRRKRSDPEVWEREKAANRERYHGLSGYEYNALLLRHRRTKALNRMRTRNQLRNEEE